LGNLKRTKPRKREKKCNKGRGFAKTSQKKLESKGSYQPLENVELSRNESLDEKRFRGRVIPYLIFTTKILSSEKIVGGEGQFVRQIRTKHSKGSREKFCEKEHRTSASKGRELRKIPGRREGEPSKQDATTVVKNA